MDISNLSSEERLELIERLWDSLSDDEVALTEAQRQELDALDLDGVPWEQVNEELSRG